MCSDQGLTPMTCLLCLSLPHPPPTLPFTTQDVFIISSLQINFFTSLNLSCLFYRWSYGVLLYEIFTIGKLLGRLRVQ